MKKSCYNVTIEKESKDRCILEVLSAIFILTNTVLIIAASYMNMWCLALLITEIASIVIFGVLILKNHTAIEESEEEV